MVLAQETLGPTIFKKFLENRDCNKIIIFVDFQFWLQLQILSRMAYDQEQYHLKKPLELGTCKNPLKIRTIIKQSKSRIFEIFFRTHVFSGIIYNM